MYMSQLISFVSVGGVFLAQQDPSSMGSKLSGLAPAAIWATVCVVSMGINLRLYKDKSAEMAATLKAKDAHADKLYSIIEDNTKATQAHTDAARSQVVAMQAIQVAVSRCKGN